MEENTAAAAKKRFAVLTWGCQMNVDDSEQIANLLEGEGMAPTDDLSQAKVIILNTCSVRQKPEDKVFSKLGITSRNQLAEALPDQGDDGA